MNIHYKIVELWPDDHLIVVRYWTDVITEEMLASDANRKEDGTPVRCRSDISLNLPIPVPTGNDLDIFLKSAGPIGWLKMLEDVKDPNVNTDTSGIKSLVNVQKTTTFDEISNLHPRAPVPTDLPNLPVLNDNTELTEDDIKKMIENIKK
jgi:hypothetical protein